MRLLNTETLELRSFISAGAETKYAILSHTWGEDELLFDDVKQGSQHIPTHKEGFAKVRGSCAKAKEDGYEWMWIDTCCIDKSSSAELSEAINSMFKWYMRAAVCYAYISDLGINGGELRRSRWFGRGWTLQELIAPSGVIFLNEKWERIGDRSSMHSELADITKIDARFLRPRQGSPSKVLKMLSEVSIATRISWAAERETTREEDIAYCLLGILEVNMPLLYGEGGDKAFRRLQSEVLQTPNSADFSILAIHKWLTLDAFENYSILARHPSSFRGVAPMDAPDRRHIDMKAGGEGIVLAADGSASFSALVGPVISSDRPSFLGRHSHIIVLDCNFTGDILARPGILVSASYLGPLEEENRYYRTRGPVLRISPEVVHDSGEAMVPFPSSAGYDHLARFRISDLQAKVITLMPAPAGDLKRKWPPIRIITSLKGQMTRTMDYKTSATMHPIHQVFRDPQLERRIAADRGGASYLRVLEFGYVQVSSGMGVADPDFRIHWGVSYDDAFHDATGNARFRPPYSNTFYSLCCAIFDSEGEGSTQRFESSGQWHSSVMTRRPNGVVICASMKEAHFLGRMSFQMDISDESG